MQRAAHRADRAGERGGDVGAGRGDDAGGEGRGVHAVLGRRAPVGVDRLDVLGVRLAAPADQELLGERRALVDLAAAGRPAGRARAPTGRRTTAPSRRPATRSCAGLLVGDVVGLAACRASARASRPRPARRRARRRCGSGCCRARPAAGPGCRSRRSSSPQTFSNGTRPTMLLDVDAAVAQRRALLVGLGDLGLERDDALESVVYLGHARSCDSVVDASASRSHARRRLPPRRTPVRLVAVLGLGVTDRRRPARGVRAAAGWTRPTWRPTRSRCSSAGTHDAVARRGRTSPTRWSSPPSSRRRARRRRGWCCSRASRPRRLRLLHQHRAPARAASWRPTRACALLFPWHLARAPGPGRGRRRRR